MINPCWYTHVTGSWQKPEVDLINAPYSLSTYDSMDNTANCFVFANYDSRDIPENTAYTLKHYVNCLYCIQKYNYPRLLPFT